MRKISQLLAGFAGLCTALAPHAASAFTAKQVAFAPGTDVWFDEDHTLPMIALVASFPAGSVYDPAGKSGLAAFAASLMDEGAGGMNSNAFHGALADRAIQLSITPQRDNVVVSLTTLTANAKEAFGLLALALAHPRFDADAIARVRAQMVQNLRQQEQDPGSVSDTAFDRAFFAGNPYGRAVGGDDSGLAAITQEDLRSFAHAHWVRGGLKISVAGDIDTRTLTDDLRATFGNLSSIAPAAPQAPAKVGATGVQIVAMDVPQPTATFGLPGILRSDPDFLPGYVANYILGGGGFSSRLMNEVREKRGLTYGISTDIVTYRKTGLIEGVVATRRGGMNQTIAVVRETLRKFATDGPTPQELADAKTYLTGSYPLAFSSDAGIAGQLNAFQRAGLPVDYVTRRNGMIDAITLADVRRAAKRLFDPAKLTVVVAGTLAK
jgi:zinc protease